jgi:hypothetical protein
MSYSPRKRHRKSLPLSLVQTDLPIPSRRDDNPDDGSVLALKEIGLLSRLVFTSTDLRLVDLERIRKYLMGAILGGSN